MHPELFRIPFTDLTVKGYGFLMVCGFISAIYLIRRLSRDLGDHSEHITSAALYSLIAGVVGARIFYVIHYWPQFSEKPFTEIFTVWKGGLELLGGVLLATVDTEGKPGLAWRARKLRSDAAVKVASAREALPSR